jgi:hypothetical protein
MKLEAAGVFMQICLWNMTRSNENEVRSMRA